MNQKIQIYHNPRCTKSREALALIKDSGLEPEIIEYLKQVPTKEELKMILMKLNLKPEEIVRKGESVYKEKLKNMKLSDEEWIQVLLENPILIERPIVVKGNKAVVGRPIDNVVDLIKK
jgi:arsenate reductase (glutaredoxin)